MLQRSQTLFLLGVFILSLFLLTGPITRGNKMGVATWPLSALFAVVAVLAFLNIFFYKHRMRQIRIAVFLILLNAGMIGMMFYYTFIARIQIEGALVMHQWRFVIPPINMILLYFAFRRIRRDEVLVKAFDRIR